MKVTSLQLIKQSDVDTIIMGTMGFFSFSVGFKVGLVF